MAAPVEPGDVLVGKYKVERVLGQGGMGVVVAAEHLQLGRRVALKFMLPAALEAPGASERFLREARAAARLRSNNVAQVIDVGTLENGAPYMVMEFLEGADLGELLEERGPMPVHIAVNYMLQACTAMEEAHAQKIVHRDLKPENLFLTTTPSGKPLIKVLDFGISKILDGTSDLSATRTGMAMGSPAYMAPEQMKSAKDADPRADIWSMGAVLHELVSGQLPFEATTFTEMMARVLTEEPRSLTGNFDPAFAAVIRKCMERDLAARFQSVTEFAAALAPFASIPNGRAPTPPPVMTTQAPMSQGTAPSHASFPAETPPALGQMTAPPIAPAKSKAPLWAGLILALAGAAVLSVVLMGRGSEGDKAAVQPSQGEAAPIDAGVATKANAKAPTIDAAAPTATPIDAAPVDAAPIDAAPADAAPKKKKRRKRRRRRDPADPFGSMH